MSERTRSHELEELSVRRFRDRLPPKWVSRSKQPDYGIDCEVEVFDEDGASTGLMFLVQLRATDDAERGDRVRLKVSEADYYAQFDLPVAVVRYCSVTDAFHWAWADIIRSRISLASDQASFTYVFSEEERWAGATPAQIRRTLDVRRALAAFPPGAPIPIRLELDRIPAEARFPIERAMAKAIASSNGVLVRAVGATQPIEVHVVPEPAYLAVRIDSLASTTFDLVDPAPDDYITATLYGLVRLLMRKRLVRQAEVVARVIIARGRPFDFGDLAITACQALARDLPALVDLAIVNDLHDQTVVFHSVIARILFQAPQDDAARWTAVDRFFAASLEAARAVDPDSEAASHYSIGNFYRGQRGLQGTLTRAFREYNSARRLRPAYLRTGYFLRELGGVLFERRRYAAAVRSYQAAHALDPAPDLAFLLGDALLLSGGVAEAQDCFADAAAHAEESGLVQEAELKRLTCTWLLATARAERVPRRCSEARRLHGANGLYDPTALAALLAEVDGLDPLAHFNLGITRARQGDRASALNHFLLCAFVQPNDAEAWANAAMCALGLRQNELLVAIMAVAVHKAGAEAYERLRRDLIVQGADATMIADLDEVAMRLLAEAEAPSDTGFTLRLLNGDRYETISTGG